MAPAYVPSSPGVVLMAQIITYQIGTTGTPPSPRAAAAGDTAEVSSGCVLEVTNGGGSSITVTIVTPGVLGTGDAYPDKAYTVAAGASLRAPLLRDYMDPADGLAHISYSATTSVTVAVTKAPIW